MSERRFWRSVAILWGAAAIVLIAVAWSRIATGAFPDPDDQLRLLEVRDWIAGQGWFDVTQHRLNVPDGVPMHWSRLVDIPIAAVILLLRPMLGAVGAEQAALVVVPLLTLAIVLALVAVIARRMLGDEPGLLAPLLALLSTEVLQQFRPLRIDHHGWQMALALVATLGLLDSNRRRGGWIAGAAVAIWLAISLEGLPMAVAILSLAGLRWVLTPGEAGQARATPAGMAVTSLFLFVATRSPAVWGASECDAISPPYLAMLGIVALGMAGATLAPPRTSIARFAALAMMGITALAAIPLVAPACVSGPFVALDPLVRSFWYLHVAEGLPIWRQTPPMIVDSIALPLVGLVGAALGWRDAAGGERARWATLCFLGAAALAAAIMVQRSSGVATLIAIPGAVRLVYPALLRARAITRLPTRLLATLAIVLAAAPGLAFRPAFERLSPNPGAIAVERAQVCTNANEMAALGVVPRGNVLAPLDISPAILFLTPHSAVASGHHRGAAAMHDVIAAFSGDDATARAIVTRRRVDYVAFCPGLAEAVAFEAESPSGLLARLDRGHAPAWLTPVAIRGTPLKLWRVELARPSHEPRLPEPPPAH